MDNFKSVDRYGESEIIIEKSKFFGYVKPVKCEEEAIEFINTIKEKNKMATHNVYAYIIDENLKRFSDDGEPNHTAGFPILSAMEKMMLKKVVVVVTRYFGGVLLGKGGLVRAYTETFKQALDKAEVVDKVMHYKIDLILSYNYLGQVENYINLKEITVIDKKYLEEVTISVYIDMVKLEILTQDLYDLTNAAIKIKVVEDILLSVKNNKIIKE